MAEKSRNIFPVLACSLGLALSAPLAHAQSFEDLEARLKNHPSLEAMRLQTEALREDAIVATAWPDPVVSLGINNFPVFDPSFNAFLPTNKAIGVSQQIPNGLKRQAKSEEAQRRAQRSEAAEAFRFAQLRAELMVALVEKRLIGEQRGLLEKQHSLYGELEQVVESEMAAGRPVLFRLAEIDLMRAELARSRAELKGAAGNVDARLVDLVGEAADTDSPPLEPIIWSGDPGVFHQVQIARAEIRTADASVARAEVAWKPDWGLQLTYQQRNSGGVNTRFEGDDWVSAAVTFSVPLWGNRSQTPALRSAKARREGARNRREAAARSAAAHYAALDAAHLAAEEAIAALNYEVNAIGEQIQAQRTRYESGIGDYSPVIDGKLAELVLRTRIFEQQARRDQAVARLNALMVTS